MLKQEKNYDFRKRMLEVHEKNIRDTNLLPTSQELEFSDGLTVVLPEDCDDIILTAAKDFIEYLFISMRLGAMLKSGGASGQGNEIVISLAKEAGVNLEEAEGYRGYRIDTNDNAVMIYGADERGIAQALYYLEDVMTMRKAPYLPKGSVKCKPMYSPQMVHSGYGLDEYPNEHLSAIAHEGRDAILVFVKDVHVTPYGYLDFNELIYRASKYGLDEYAYSYYKSDKHPDDPEAEAHYESTYGTLFKECPGLKGVFLVGESVEFPSKDEHVSGHHRSENVVEGIPTGKMSPGYYPCMDYPQWLNLVKKVIRKYNSEADIIFCTYNWGWQPEADRVKLIEALPTDITLQPMFENYSDYQLGANTCYCADYTLSKAGYGSYFKSEAEAAKKRGIRLYSMANTGGLTWDFGVIPYEPFPYQWIKRYKAMQEAHEKWELCGIMESHHYGFYPSFISKLSKWAFYENHEDMEEILYRILVSEYGSEAAPEVDRALRLWSDAITHYIPSDADQYGAFRVGPSYPLCLDQFINLQAAPYSMFGSAIVYPVYQAFNFGRQTATSIRIHAEIESLQKMRALMAEGIAIMEGITDKNDKLLYLLNLGKFILCSVVTGIHAKKFHCLKCAMAYESDRDKCGSILDELEAVLLAEKENAESAIPLVQVDSRLGWEPSMEYMTDEAHIRWKLRHLDYVLKTELEDNRKSCLMWKKA